MRQNTIDGRCEKVKPPVKRHLTLVDREVAARTKHAKKREEQYFLENQRVLPILPQERLEKVDFMSISIEQLLDAKLMPIVTQHRAFKKTDTFDDDIKIKNIRRKRFKEVWTDEMIIVLHDDLLMHSLTMLRKCKTDEEKFDILSWVFADEILMWHNRHEHAIKVPFSFHACCYVLGKDPDYIKTCVLKTLPEHIKAKILQLEAA